MIFVYSFAQQSNLIEHFKVIHEQGKFLWLNTGQCFSIDICLMFVFLWRLEFEAQRKKDEDFKIMSKYFDLSCDWEGCDIMFDSLEMAKSHYSDCHQSDDFYIKCCDAKFREPNLVKDHVAWHQNPDIFKYAYWFIDKKILNPIGIQLFLKYPIRLQMSSMWRISTNPKNPLLSHIQT